MFVVSSSIQIPPEEFQLTFARSGGPGGQNVNKVNSKAILRWRVLTTPSLPEHVRRRFMAKFATRITLDGDLILTSQQYRDQASNIDYCMEKLRAMILEVVIRRHHVDRQNQLKHPKFAGSKLSEWFQSKSSSDGPPTLTTSDHQLPKCRRCHQRFLQARLRL